MRVHSVKQNLVSVSRQPTLSLYMAARVRDDSATSCSSAAEGSSQDRKSLESSRSVGSRCLGKISEGEFSLGSAGIDFRDDFGVITRRASFEKENKGDSRLACLGVEFRKAANDSRKLLEEVSQGVTNAFSGSKDEIIVRNKALHERRTRSLPAGGSGILKESKASSASISFFQSTANLGRSLVVADENHEHDFDAEYAEKQLKITLFVQAAFFVGTMVACALCVYGLLHFLSGPPVLSFNHSFQFQTSNNFSKTPTPECNFLAKTFLASGLTVTLLMVALSSLDFQPWRKHGDSSCKACRDMDQNRSRVEAADDRAQRAQIAKQQFIAYVFHNIRVPFNAIVLGLGHMRATSDGESEVDGEGAKMSMAGEKMDLVQMMLDCAETMTSVLDDVTDMGQWEGGKMEVSYEEFNLLGVVNFLSWGLKDLIEQNSITFRMNVDPLVSQILSTHHVLGDKQRIVQTLGNFLSNAVKFSVPGGQLELDVHCEEVVETDSSSTPLALPARPSAAAGVSDAPSVRSGRGFSFATERVHPSPFSSKLHPTVQKQQLHSGIRQHSGKIAKIRISVKDTGVGISPADQMRLFEPYSIVTAGWVQKEGVSGLGLSMARRFVEQVGGRIGVDSKEGEGSTFHFCIPFPLVQRDSKIEPELPSAFQFSRTDRHASSATDESEVTDPPSGKPRTPSNLRGSSKEIFFKNRTPKWGGPGPTGEGNNKRKVLLVEDTKINRIILRKVLQNLNLHCDEAENGQVAVDYFKEGRTYDLILMDKEMPVMDGHEATRKIRMMGVKTPIIALTGNAMQNDRELFFEAGVDDFQTKPLSREKLVKLLVRFGMESSCGSR